MTSEKITIGIIALRTLYEKDEKKSVYDNLTDYLEWLEVRVVSVLLNNKETSTINKSVDKIDSDGC